jgi:hypothetical protein
MSIEVTLDQQQFLPGEKLTAAIRITNRSGQTLHLGDDEDWLSLSIEGQDGSVLPRFGDIPVQGEFTLDSSKVATKRIDLAPYFPLTTPGRYSIIATVKVKEWGNERTSNPKGFYIIRGSHLWEQEFGVPKRATDTNALPELRKYMLQQANYVRGNLRLYLRITDPGESKIFRVIPIGMMLSFSHPEAQIDTESNLHLIYLNSPHALSYSVFNPDGELLTRQTYEITPESRPRLKMTAGDKISVVGGVRREAATDFPPTKASQIEGDKTRESIHDTSETNEVSSAKS